MMNFLGWIKYKSGKRPIAADTWMEWESGEVCGEQTYRSVQCSSGSLCFPGFISALFGRRCNRSIKIRPIVTSAVIFILLTEKTGGSIKQCSCTWLNTLEVSFSILPLFKIPERRNGTGRSLQNPCRSESLVLGYLCSTFILITSCFELFQKKACELPVTTQ